MTELLSPTNFFALSAGIMAAVVAVGQPIFGLLLLVIAAVAIDLVTHNLILMGIADGVIVGMLILAILREKQVAYPGERIRMRTPLDGNFFWLGALSIVYLIVGMARGNDLVFALGDFYHVFLEMAVPFFLCAIFLRRLSRLESFVNTMAMSMLVLSGIILVLYATGILQQFEGSGMYYRHSSMWRIRVNSNYPMFPLVWLLGIWLFSKPGRQRNITGLACLALTIVLILTLKRTLWIGFAGLTVFYFMVAGQRQQFAAVRTVMIGAVALVGVAWFVVPKDKFDPARDLEVYTHSIQKRFSSRDSDINVSWNNRVAQLSDAMVEIGKNPLGYGLGNEAMVRFSYRGTRQPIHYIHNAFIHYQLLMGIWYPLLLFLISIGVIGRGLRLFRQLDEGWLKGAVLGAVGSFVAILVSSITEIGTNTFFLPFSAAFVVLAEKVVESEGLARSRLDRLRERVQAQMPGAP